ncbi:ran GTPase-activating protein 1-like isoform X2 [Sycon ciliatum]|uniref:ran GTPase-activating protein 1-like isoform X2 n=1 Tax=Sycon ciliatum TaxID=27933 RepID=UPI0031F6E594
MSSPSLIEKAVESVSLEDNICLSFKDLTLKLESAEDAAPVVRKIVDAPQLEELCLSGNTIGVEAAKAIAKALSEKPTFKRAMWGDIFTGRLRSEIPLALRALGEAVISSGAQLEAIDLSDNAFGPDGVEAVRELLVSRAGFSLQSLRFHNNGLGPGGGKILSEALLQCHKNATAAGVQFAPKSVVVNRNRLRDEGATHLAEAYKALGSLQQLSMFENSILAPGIIALANSFPSNPNLEDINLCDNTFTSEGGVAMAKVLPSLKNLRAVNFDDCLVRSDGLSAIADAFYEACPKLETVHLAHNEADGTSGMAVARALVAKPSIKAVDLNGNMFGASIVTEMEQMFPSSVLHSLDEDEDEDGDDDDGRDNEYDEGADSEGDAPDTRDAISVSSVDSRLERLAFPAEPLSLDDARAALLDPSSARIVQLGKQLDTLKQAVQAIQDDVKQVAIAFSEACNVVRQGDEQAQSAEAFSDCLLSSSLSHQHSKVTGDSLVGEILVQMGLLKSEDKIVPRLSDVGGGLVLLRHVAMQAYFPKDAAATLAAFLTKEVLLYVKRREQVSGLPHVQS